MELWDAYHADGTLAGRDLYAGVWVAQVGRVLRAAPGRGEVRPLQVDAGEDAFVCGELAAD